MVHKIVVSRFEDSKLVKNVELVIKGTDNDKISSEEVFQIFEERIKDYESQLDKFKGL